MDTVSLTIDGKTVTAEKGRTVLQAAIEAGIRVPYYCYHPGLGIDGSCRVCIVKIDKMPKLQTSCSTTVTEGMVVHTGTPDVVEARASVFEFLLINHPLDCPVCDKGGECPLQDFSYSFGPNESRMGFPRRVFDGEGVKADVDFGPTLLLNRNRCILCTRCVRFMKEVDTDAQINIVDRGYGSEIATFQEEGVHSLLSGNLMDVCPVGAITTRDYRFKARPWDNPEAVDTICTLCEKGCNTTAWLKAKPEWAKGARLARMTPRFNPEVNGYWMCDIGRFNYHWIEGDERLEQPLVGWCACQLEPGARDVVGAGRGGRRTLCAALPHLRARVARRALGPRPARRRVQPAGNGRGDQLADERQGTAAECEVQGAARGCPERPRRARSRIPSQRHRHWRSGPVRVPIRRRGRPRGRALRVRPRTRRVDRRRVVGDRGEEGGTSQTARRSRRAADGSREGRRHRPPRRILDREGRDLRQHGRPASGVRARDLVARRSAARLEDPRRRRPGARRRRHLPRQRRDPGGARRGHGRQPDLRQPDDDCIRATRLGADVDAGVEPIGALEVGLHVPGPAAREVRRPPRPVGAAGRDPDEGSGSSEGSPMSHLHY